MGGLSARLAALDPGAPEGFVAAIVTLATPHQAPPWAATVRRVSALAPGPVHCSCCQRCLTGRRGALTSAPSASRSCALSLHAICRQAGMWAVYEEVRRGWTADGAESKQRGDALAAVAVASLAGGPRCGRPLLLSFQGAPSFCIWQRE